MDKKDSLPKLVASDIGSTLTVDVKNIPPFTAMVLNRLIAAGIPVVLITGYNYNTTMRFADSIDNRIILMPQNGSLCIREGKLIWEYRIPEPSARELCDFLAKNNLPIIIYKGREEDFDNFYVFTEELPLSYAFRRIAGLRDFENITGISTLLPDNMAKKVRSMIRDIVGKKFKVIYNREVKRSWLEVTHKEVRKDLSLKRLCAEMGIPLDDVIYFGDNFNDREALRIVGHPILVGNAAPELKEAFSTVIGTVNEESAAHYLNDLFDLKLKED